MRLLLLSVTSQSTPEIRGEVRVYRALVLAVEEQGIGLVPSILVTVVAVGLLWAMSKFFNK